MKSTDLDLCENCVYEKQKRVNFSIVRKNPKAEMLGLVHIDIWGKTSIPSLGGSLYFMTFIDDSSGKVLVYFSKHKSDVFDMSKKWLA